MDGPYQMTRVSSASVAAASASRLRLVRQAPNTSEGGIFLARPRVRSSTASAPPPETPMRSSSAVRKRSGLLMASAAVPSK